jgi:hypothetical protein
MFSWFSSLAGNSSILSKAVSGIDMLVFTEEEQKQYAVKQQELYLKLEEQVNKQSTPRALSRRYIALLIVIPYMSLATGTCIAALVADNLTIAAEILATLMLPFTSVILFYYGTQGISTLKNKDA